MSGVVSFRAQGLERLPVSRGHGRQAGAEGGRCLPFRVSCRVVLLHGRASFRLCLTTGLFSSSPLESQRYIYKKALPTQFILTF